MPPSLSVILPAYNEAEHIVENIFATATALDSMNLDYELILVDDGSNDGTAYEAAKILGDARAKNLRVLRNDKNQGKGNAVICGFAHSRGELIAFLDADLDLHPRQLGYFIEIMALRNVDIVIGSKMHRDSVVDYPVYRRIYSTGYFWLTKALFGLPVRDTQTGIKLFKRSVLADVLPRVLVKRFAFDVELLANAHRLGFSMAEAPIELEFQRVAGRLNSSDVRSILLDTLAIFYRMKLRHYYDRSEDDLALRRLYAGNAREMRMASLQGILEAHQFADEVSRTEIAS